MTLGEPRAGEVAEIANMLAELTAAAQARRQASLAEAVAHRTLLSIAISARRKE